MLNKVPEATLVFWIAKIIATSVGETGAGFLAVELDFGLGGTSVVMIALPLVARSPGSAPGAASLVSTGSWSCWSAWPARRSLIT
jgi:hypothetical protein